MHEVIRGISVENIFAEVPAESNGAGSKGSVRSAATSTVTDTLASTSTRLLRSVPSFVAFFSVFVLFPMSSRLH